jgi:Rrf2 family transcriptional regulator, iron-sulfur cluster assembly transcription factor
MTWGVERKPLGERRSVCSSGAFDYAARECAWLKELRGVELNTRGRYAVMAMADLARFCADQPSVPLSAIAERQMISLAYLEQLFGKLRRAGLVESVRGRSGGYRLARTPDGITVAEVMAAVAESTHMTRCGVEAGEPCLAGKRCLTHDLWDALGEHIDQFLAGVTLQQVLDGRIGRARQPIPPPNVVFSGGLVSR